MSSTTTGTLVFLLVVGAMLGWFVQLKAFYRRLQEAHPDVHASLGRPTGSWHNTTRGRRQTIGFLVAGRHTTLHDPRLHRLGSRVLAWLYGTVLIGLLAIAVAMLWPPGTR